MNAELFMRFGYTRHRETLRLNWKIGSFSNDDGDAEDDAL